MKVSVSYFFQSGEWVWKSLKWQTAEVQRLKRNFVRKNWYYRAVLLKLWNRMLLQWWSVSFDTLFWFSWFLWTSVKLYWGFSGLLCDLYLWIYILFLTVLLDHFLVYVAGLGYIALKPLTALVLFYSVTATCLQPVRLYFGPSLICYESVTNASWRIGCGSVVVFCLQDYRLGGVI